MNYDIDKLMFFASWNKRDDFAANSLYFYFVSIKIFYNCFDVTTYAVS